MAKSDYDDFKQNFGAPTNEEIKNQLKQYTHDFKIGFYDEQPNTLFIESKNPKLKDNYIYKVHIQCKIQKIMNVIKIILKDIYPILKKDNWALLFKIINSPLTLSHGWTSYPFIGNNVEIDGTSIESYFREHPQNSWKQLTPDEISSKTIGFRDDHSITYSLGEEEYEFEKLFIPNIVFYVESEKYAVRLVNLLKAFFNDKFAEENDMVYPNFHPRHNIQINNMVYVSTGDTGEKEKRIECSVKNKHYKCKSYSKVSYPEEYKEIMNSCPEQKDQESCEQRNNFPKRVSGHRLCEWREDRCRGRSIHSPTILLGNDKKSIYDLYKGVNREDVYRKMDPENEFIKYIVFPGKKGYFHKM